MIEQTDLVVSKWNYHLPLNAIVQEEELTSNVSLHVMKKRAATKKGIACRFTVEFVFEQQMILEYTGEDSYVIDLADVIDKNELHIMIRNSYNKFKEKFDFRKLGTMLQNKTLIPFDEKMYDLDPILLLLNE